MPMDVREIRAWLNTLPDDAEVGIAEKDMAICVRGRPDVYLEIGMAAMSCDACNGTGQADGIGDVAGIYGSDNCGACGGSGIEAPARPRFQTVPGMCWFIADDGRPCQLKAHTAHVAAECVLPADRLPEGVPQCEFMLGDRRCGLLDGHEAHALKETSR